MKKFLGIFAFALILVLSAYFIAIAAQPTVTITKKSYGGMEAYYFTFATTAVPDTAYLLPSGSSYYDIDDMNFNSITLYSASSETTTDSVSYVIDYQVKGRPSDASWVTALSQADSDAVAFTNVLAPATYGFWPITRFRIRTIGNNADATITGYVLFKKD